MKTLKFYLTALLIAAALFANAQKKIDSKIFESLPQDLKLSDEIQKFVVTTDHFNSDIFCNFYNKQRVYGEYTRDSKNGKAKWNNVSFAMIMEQDAEFPKGTPINYMENFSYNFTDDMLKPEAFESFNENSAFTKNLIWDMFAIESFAWNYWDKLELNKSYSAPEMNGKLDLAGQGSFENKDIQLIWTGVSKRNGETCATIEYRTLNNPLEVTADGMDMKGRSHYWGTIWVSLEDKQIEHAVLYEDVVMEMLLPGQTQKSIVNATREISFVRML